jgi:acyl carrier protein
MDPRTVLLDALHRVAPEVDPATVDPAGDLRDQLELDSMDFLNLVTAVGERLGFEIPERDYPHLASLDGFVAYLEAKVGSPA